MLTRLLLVAKGALALMLCLLFAGTVSEAAAPLPTFASSLSDESIVAGEPLFVRYSVTNTTSQSLQLLWSGEKPSWLNVEILDSENKVVSTTTAPLKQFDGSMPGWWSKKKSKEGINKVLILRPGQTFKSKLPVTASTAMIAKPGVYHLAVHFAYRIQETEEASASLPNVSDKVKREITTPGYNMTETDDAEPNGLPVGEKSKILRLVIKSVNPAALAERAKQLREIAIQGSGQEAKEAVEKLASWPSASALDVWVAFSQEDKQNSERLGRTLPGQVNNLILQVIQNGNSALLPFLENLTWKSNVYDAHQTFEKLYVNGDDATRKAILILYTKHNEEFPSRPVNY